MRITQTVKSSESTQAWYVVDATDLPLGRMSSEIAKILRGKNKPTFTPNMDTGDNVIVINAEKIALTGRNKAADMLFHWHTGFPGGIKNISAAKELSGRFPERLVERSIKRMLPKESPLARQQYGKLHVYAGSEHPHAAQKPQSLALAELIGKRNNKRSS